MIRLRLFSFIIGIFICGIFSLMYVHQEIEIVKTSYAINNQQRKLAFLLDQHRSLVYNLYSLESPKRIEDNLNTKEIVLCMPQGNNILYVENITPVYGNKKQESPPKSFLASVFDHLSVKAEAKDTE